MVSFVEKSQKQVSKGKNLGPTLNSLCFEIIWSTESNDLEKVNTKGCRVLLIIHAVNKIIKNFESCSCCNMPFSKILVKTESLEMQYFLFCFDFYLY